MKTQQKKTDHIRDIISVLVLKCAFLLVTAVHTALAQWLQCWVCSSLALSASELLPQFSSESCDAFSLKYRRYLLILKGLRQRNQPKGSSYLGYHEINSHQSFINSVFSLFSSVICSHSG